MQKVKSFVLLVRDQQEALDFYTEKLGFAVHTDASFGEGNRWLTVCLPGQEEFEISLAPVHTDEGKAMVGKQSDADNALLGITTDDIEADIARFKANGVELEGDLIDEPYGKFIFLRDLYGNRLYLHEEK
ncbi:MAG: VOC family protein [Acidobacteria bacterium]|nr:VOC family protein [Acidobacteriota bacterium]